MTFRIVLIAVLLVGLVTGMASFTAAAETSPNAVRPDGTPNRALWMAQGSFGVMTHYLPHPKGATPEERIADLNRTVDQFDLDGYIAQFEQTGADWLIFTLGQTNGYLCSPNAYLESRSPGLTSRRDLALEIAQRLEKLHKRLILYLPGIDNADPVIKDALAATVDGYTERHLEFLRQYSLKFGRLHHGWWFDACGVKPDEYWQKWLSAVRAGNPEAVVAFSGAEFCASPSVNPICRFDDYHPGEIHLLEDGQIRHDFLPPGGDIIVNAEGKLRLRGQEALYYLPDGPFLGGVQWHGLLPIDLTFNPAIPNQFCHYTDKELITFVRHVKSVGGALTINVPIEVETGHIPVDTHAQLVRLSQALKTPGK